MDSTKDQLNYELESLGISTNSKTISQEFIISENYKFENNRNNLQNENLLNLYSKKKILLTKPKFLFLSSLGLASFQKNCKKPLVFSIKDELTLHFIYKDCIDIIKIEDINTALEFFSKFVIDNAMNINLYLKIKGNFKTTNLIIPDNFNLCGCKFNNCFSTNTFNDVLLILNKVDFLEQIKLKNFQISSRLDNKSFLEIINKNIQDISLVNIENYFLTESEEKISSIWFSILTNKKANKKQNKKEKLEVIINDPSKILRSLDNSLKRLVLKNSPLIDFPEIINTLKFGMIEDSLNLFIDRNSFISYSYQVYKLKLRDLRVSVWFNNDIEPKREEEAKPPLEIINLFNFEDIEEAHFVNYDKDFFLETKEDDNYSEIDTGGFETKLFFTNCSYSFINYIIENKAKNISLISFKDCIQFTQKNPLLLSSANQNIEFRIFNSNLKFDLEKKKIKKLSIYYYYLDEIIDLDGMIEGNKVQIQSEILGNMESVFKSLDDNPEEVQFLGDSFDKFFNNKWTKNIKKITIGRTHYTKKLHEKVKSLLKGLELTFEKVEFEVLPELKNIQIKLDYSSVRNLAFQKSESSFQLQITGILFCPDFLKDKTVNYSKVYELFASSSVSISYKTLYEKNNIIFILILIKILHSIKSKDELELKEALNRNFEEIFIYAEPNNSSISKGVPYTISDKSLPDSIYQEFLKTYGPNKLFSLKTERDKDDEDFT